MVASPSAESDRAGARRPVPNSGAAGKRRAPRDRIRGPRRRESPGRHELRELPIVVGLLEGERGVAGGLELRAARKEAEER